MKSNLKGQSGFVVEDWPEIEETNRFKKDEAMYRKALAAQMASAPPDKMLPLWGDLLRWSPEPAFAAVNAPLFAINGEMIPDVARQRCAGRVTETVLAYPGHFPQWERPGEFSQALNKQLEALRL